MEELDEKDYEQYLENHKEWNEYCEETMSDDTIMDVGELLGVLKQVPKNSRVTMKVGDRVIPVSRVISFGIYDPSNENFNLELHNADEDSTYAVCFTPQEDEE